MLVLSRKVGEAIVVGEKISITVVRISPGVVRLGIEAPDDVTILRQELTGIDQEKKVGTGAEPTGANASTTGGCEVPSPIFRKEESYS